MPLTSPLTSPLTTCKREGENHASYNRRGTAEGGSMTPNDYMAVGWCIAFIGLFIGAVIGHWLNRWLRRRR